MPEFLSTLIYAVRYNLTGILFYAAAAYFALRGRTFRHWYLIGLVIQGYSVLGALLGIHLEPEQWQTAGNYAAVILFAVLSLVFGLLMLREEKRLSTAERKARAQEARKAAEAQRKK